MKRTEAIENLLWHCGHGTDTLINASHRPLWQSLDLARKNLSISLRDDVDLFLDTLQGVIDEQDPTGIQLVVKDVQVINAYASIMQQFADLSVLNSANAQNEYLFLLWEIVYAWEAFAACERVRLKDHLQQEFSVRFHV